MADYVDSLEARAAREYLLTPAGQLVLDDDVLGRTLATPKQVLEVIRPQLRAMRAYYRGSLLARQQGWIESDDDLELTDGGDVAADNAVHASLWLDAMENVRQWAKDVEVVFDSARLREFVRLALSNAMVTEDGIEMLPEGILGY